MLYLPALRSAQHGDAGHVFSASYWSFLLAPAPAIVAARMLGKRIVLNYHSGEADDHLTRWSVAVHPWCGWSTRSWFPSGYLAWSSQARIPVACRAQRRGPLAVRLSRP
jgi:hypothetical protein